MLFKKKIDKNQNLLRLTPKIKVEFEKIDDSKIRLRIPRFKSAFAQKYLIPKFISKKIVSDLDEFGSVCLQLIDTKRTVEEIAIEMRKSFGERIEPVHERVTVYLYNMYRADFISFLEVE